VKTIGIVGGVAWPSSIAMKAPNTQIGHSAYLPLSSPLAHLSADISTAREALHGVQPSPGLTACSRAQSHGS
jgi:hypothetical protein